MGVEVQLFYVKLKKSIDFDKLDAFLQELGCIKEQSQFNTWRNYVISTNKGITELQLRVIDGEIKDFSIRFSFGNPETVIDQTLTLFKKLLEIFPIEIYSTAPTREITFINKSVDRLKNEFLKKKEFFDEHYMKINKPIRGGAETFDYIRKHKNANR